MEDIDSERPFELTDDGNLPVARREECMALISKVKGHADEEMVRLGQIREVDRIGNDLADDAADFGRLMRGA